MYVGCRRGVARNRQNISNRRKRQRKAKGKNAELILRKVSADAREERGGRNEAEVVRNVNASHRNFHCP
jgi:hypothetical protein